MPIRLKYQPPYDWPAMLSYLRARAIDGIERVEGERYLRTFAHEDGAGTVEIAHLPRADSLAATIRFSSAPALPTIAPRIRRVFDLDADVLSIGAHLARDPALARLVQARPGLRVPGAWDGFELAMRAILGQQVTLEAGRQLAGKLARICGSPIVGSGTHDSLTLTFPNASQVAKADLSALGMPNARRKTLHAMANAALDDPLLFQRLETIERTVARLREIPGIGDWTAHYIALRAAREPDAFPSSDIGLLRGAADDDGTRPTPAVLLQRAQHWRPWRAYAAQHLWTADAASPRAITRPKRTRTRS